MPGATVTGLKNQIIGLGRFVETTPTCPGNGTYTFGQTSGSDTIPPMGELYLQCSLAVTNQHVPSSYTDW